MIDINELRQSLGAVQPEEVAELLDRLEEAESVLKAFGTTVQEVECWLERYRCIEREAEALRTRLEAAESDALEQARLNGMGGEREAALMAKLEAAEKERDALRAKVDAMERQEPAEWQCRSRPSWGGRQWSKWERCSPGHAQDIAKSPTLHDWQYEARPLYALPGAKGEW